jgi:ABC-type proline/glycine betaine transport system substrate-binding protein
MNGRKKERRKERNLGSHRAGQRCHIESLHWAGVALTADVLRTAIKETHCTTQIKNRENKGKASV